MSIMPRRRWQRVTIYLVLTLGYAAVLWFYLFPYLDKTFINRPAL